MDLEEYTTGTGQALWVHPESDCDGEDCTIHNPSNHHMREWPTHWRGDKGSMERICKCGVGHPDPDDLAFKIKMAKKFGRDYEHLGVHGCCGCCKIM